MSGIMYAILGLDMDFCTYAVSNGSMELPTIAITRKAEPLLVSPLRSVSASENGVGYMIDSQSLRLRIHVLSFSEIFVFLVELL